MNAIVSNQATPQNDIIDISINGIGKKKIRINGDDNKILLLNTNDNNVVVRYTDVYPKLKELENDFKELGELKTETEDIDSFTAFANKARDIDTKMRDSLDYIFNSNVSEVCSDGGSMYDFLDGGIMRWEAILTSLIGLYTETINRNAEQAKKVKQLTSKYIK